jgi:hypothetical protein
MQMVAIAAEVHQVQGAAGAQDAQHLAQRRSAEALFKVVEHEG